MHDRITTRDYLTGTLLLVCALGVATTAFGRSTKDVKLRMENDQLVVESKKGDNGCSFWAKRGPGCVKVDKNDKADIDFNLVGDTKCNLAYGTDWELEAVYLGGYDAEEKPAAAGFATTPQADFDKVNADFGGVDKDSGFVKSAQVDKKKIRLGDENGHEYVVWYTVTATCPRTDGKEAHKSATDPRIRNGGTG